MATFVLFIIFIIIGCAVTYLYFQIVTKIYNKYFSNNLKNFSLDPNLKNEIMLD